MDDPVGDLAALWSDRRDCGGGCEVRLQRDLEHPLAVDFVRWIVLLPLLGAAINFLAGAYLQRILASAR